MTVIATDGGLMPKPQPVTSLAPRHGRALRGDHRLRGVQGQEALPQEPRPAEQRRLCPRRATSCASTSSARADEPATDKPIPAVPQPEHGRHGPQGRHREPPLPARPHERQLDGERRAPGSTCSTASTARRWRARSPARRRSGRSRTRPAAGFTRSTSTSSTSRSSAATASRLRMGAGAEGRRLRRRERDGAGRDEVRRTGQRRRADSATPRRRHGSADAVRASAPVAT